jgi:peptide/nickel transport system substrate-binding protein
LLTAYKSGEVEAINTIPPKTAEQMEANGLTIRRATLPRIFAIFFNQNYSPVLADKAVRKALNTAVDKDEIINSVLLGYGTKIDGPIGTASQTGTTTTATRIEAAQKVLTAGGWKFNTKKVAWEKTVNKKVTTLTVDLATADTAELKNTTEIIKKNWEELGVKVNMRVFEIGDLNQNVIRPRKYGALFFGEIIGRNPDLFSYWHSSQRNDPGLNISMYANSKADKILETARTEQVLETKMKKYGDLQKELNNDVPAIFIYSPDFLYSVSSKVNNLKLTSITIPSDRFINIYNWYIDTEKIWKIFAK